MSALSQSYDFHPSLLREYDIRGLVDQTLSEADLLALGRVFGTKLFRDGGRKIGLCYDGRASSPRFAAALCQGLNEVGIAVENFGLGPTPLAYFGLHHRHLDAVVVITGSHNPPEYNGIKMALRAGPVYGDAIKELGRMAKAGDVVTAGEKAATSNVDITDAYCQRIAGDYLGHGKKPLKVAWDAGNGAVGAVLKRLTDLIPGEHILLFADVDGTFPNHHPDPSVEKNLEDLKRVVREQKCDVGIAFDGDGDRIGCVTRDGTVVWSDQLAALYAREILQRVPGATIIVDVKCSQSVADLITQWGGKAIIWKAGHSLVKAKMQETKAAMGAELSGHIFFKDGFYGHDDALYCAIRLLNVIQQFGDLSEQRTIFPTVYNTPEARFDVVEEEKFAFVERAKEFVRNNAATQQASVLDIDGIRVSTPHGWWLLRASNTQNALTARAESTTAEGLAHVVAALKDALHAANCPFPEKLFG